jgi:hypothetical protein
MEGTPASTWIAHANQRAHLVLAHAGLGPGVPAEEGCVLVGVERAVVVEGRVLGERGLRAPPQPVADASRAARRALRLPPDLQARGEGRRAHIMHLV